ncbi:MAG: LytR C-terminal domain-containing protein [Ilumatobacteraceae bacterium]
MSSEVPEQSSLPPERPPRRSGEGGAPVSGALTIVLAVVAVVAGFLILRAITGDDNGDSSLPNAGDNTSEATDPDGDDDADLAPTTTTTEPAPTTTTEPPLVTAGAVVVVANANGVDGSAGAMTDELAGAGFETGTAVNATTGQLDTSVIYYDPDIEAALDVAESVNRVLGGDSSISEVGTPAPIDGGELEGGVLLVLGNDKAGSTLAELAPADDDEADDGPAVTAPEPGGDTGTDPDAETDPDN